MRTKHQLIIAWLLLGVGCGGGAFGNPTGPVVVPGSVSFSQQGTTLNPGTIVNWRSFAISPIAISGFIQQLSSSSVLNRVIGADPTTILGSLQSNGRVSLINPNGLVFTANSGAVSLTTSSVATSPSILFEASSGAITVTKGVITLAPGGSITLTDSRSPDVKVQVTAPQNRAVDVVQLLGTAGSKGISSALTIQGVTLSANAAVIGENGSIRLTLVP